jgi:general secretion pathway protein A
MEENRLGRSVLLMIDEAQCLAQPVFEEIRLLSNLETPSAKLIQIVLLGQSELRTMMRSPRFESLRQRIVLAPNLRPLTPHDTGAYLAHRLHIAADAQPHTAVFEPSAVAAIHNAADGIPRLINAIADNALLIGFVRSAASIDDQIVRAVLEEMLLFDAPKPVIVETHSERIAA